MNRSRDGINRRGALLVWVLALGFAGIGLEAAAVDSKPPTKVGTPGAKQSCGQFCAGITIRMPNGSTCRNVVPVEKNGFCECQCHDNYSPSDKKGGRIQMQRK